MSRAVEHGASREGLPILRMGHIFAGATIVLVALWIVGAAKGGYFISDRHEYVPGPNDPAIDAFSRSKKTIEMDGWRVAYIDQGSGPPVVLLHGCPFLVMGVEGRHSDSYSALPSDRAGPARTRRHRGAAG